MRRLRHRVGADHKRVLEIGSGSGELARRLSERADQVTAVDVHPPQARSDDHHVHHLVGRLEDVDLTPGAFDLVLGIHVLEHVEDVRATLRRTKELLAPGGSAYFITPNATCDALERFGAAWWMLEDPTHVRFLSPRSAELLGEQAGFTSVETRPLLADSLSCDGATIARTWQRDGTPRGSLSHPSTKALALAVLPAALALRAVRPRWRPAMELVLA